MGDQHEFKICLHARHSDTSDYSHMENFDDIFPIFQNFEETIIVKKKRHGTSFKFLYAFLTMLCRVTAAPL